MADKAYIVANKQQELDILKKLQQNNLFWLNGAMPTNFVPSKHSASMLFEQFPYIIVEGDEISWINMKQLTDEEIVYDGRKEEKKYKVTQEFMNELINWRDQRHLDMENESYYATFKHQDLRALNGIVMEWQFEEDNPIERNNRLIAIIQWLNGEDVFEVEATHKYVVRSLETYVGNDYLYFTLVSTGNTSVMSAVTDCFGSTKFDTREEAQEWANSHQVVVEIDAEGNEVEQ